MPRRTSIVLLFALLIGMTSASGAVKRPNILLILTDEHNFRTLGCYREQLSQEQAFMWGPDVEVETPNIDSIAHHGAIFTSMYASSPVCTPSRASMFTGFYPQTVGVPKNNLVLDRSVPTIATVLSENGYATGYCGKWHLSGEAKPGWEPQPRYGFQDNRYMFNRGHWKKLGLRADGAPRVASSSKGGPNSNVKGADEQSFTTDWLTNRAIEYIEEHQDQPFFYVISYPDPHTPNTVRAPYNTMFTSLKFQLPRTFLDPPDYPRNRDTPAWRRPDGKTKNLLRDMPQYFGMVRCIDDNVGRLLQKLQQCEILEDTILVFSSDHGDLCGEHTRVNKGTPLEASGLVPFLIAHGQRAQSPLIARGRVVSEAANTTDWMATLLSLLDIDDAPKTAGRDLTPLLGNDKVSDWHDVTYMRLGNWKAAVSDRYKLVVDTSDSQPWLLDLQEDPDENVNYIDNPKYTEVVKSMAQELKDYMAEHNDREGRIAAKLLDILAN